MVNYRLGSATGSLVNYFHGNASQPEPVVGMAATILSWSDRSPATVIAVKGASITVQADNAKRTDNNGLSESQEYEYSRNPDGATHVYTRRRDGSYVRKGSKMRGGPRLALGYRSKYRDPSF